MAVREKHVFTVRTDAEWAAISSPVRLEMVVFLIVAGVCSIKEIAELMDRPADGLYHHMRQLVRAGLVKEAGSRPAGKQTERLYRPVADDIRIDRNIQHKRTRERTLRLFRTIMQHALRTVQAAVANGTAILEGPQRNLSFNWLASWLDDSQLAAIREHQRAIDEILQAGLQKREGQLIAVLTYMTPIHRTRQAE